MHSIAYITSGASTENVTKNVTQNVTNIGIELFTQYTHPSAKILHYRSLRGKLLWVHDVFDWFVTAARPFTGQASNSNVF